MNMGKINQNSCRIDSKYYKVNNKIEKSDRFANAGYRYQWMYEHK